MSNTKRSRAAVVAEPEGQIAATPSSRRRATRRKVKADPPLHDEQETGEATMSTSQVAQPPAVGGRVLLTFREAMAFLRVSRSTLYRLMWSGQLRGHKVGSTWRFYEADLLAAVASPMNEPGTHDSTPQSEEAE